MEIKVLQGNGGANSPSNDSFGLVVVTRGTMSRTGQESGRVDEGYCVQVAALAPRDASGSRAVLSIVRMYAADRPAAGGAYEPCPPQNAAVDAEIERARALILAGGPAVYGIQLRAVADAPAGSQHVYRLSGTREELARESAVLRAAETLQRRPAGSNLVIERRPLHGRRWGEWRRYAVEADGWVSRVDR